MKKQILMNVRYEGVDSLVEFNDLPTNVTYIVTDISDVDHSKLKVEFSDNILDVFQVGVFNIANEQNRVLSVTPISQNTMEIGVYDNGLNVVSTSFLNTTSVYVNIDVLEQYTPFELSKLAHAQSILFGSGSEKLIALAGKIGAPRPRP